MGCQFYWCWPLYCYCPGVPQIRGWGSGTRVGITPLLPRPCWRRQWHGGRPLSTHPRRLYGVRPSPPARPTPVQPTTCPTRATTETTASAPRPPGRPWPGSTRLRWRTATRCSLSGAASGGTPPWRRRKGSPTPPTGRGQSPGSVPLRRTEEIRLSGRSGGREKTGRISGFTIGICPTAAPSC